MKSMLQSASGEIFLMLALVALLTSVSSSAPPALRVDAGEPTSAPAPSQVVEADGLSRQRLSREDGRWLLDGQPVTGAELAQQLKPGTNTVVVNGLLDPATHALMETLGGLGVAIELN